MPLRALLVALLIAGGFAGCGGMSHESKLPAGPVGANPALPEPDRSLIPTVNIARATGWPEGVTPRSARGSIVTAFASGLEHPRWLHVLPNGDVLVAESAAPPRPESGQGLRGKIMGLAMKRAGSAVPSANRITLLRDTDNDGIADVRSVFLSGLNSPFGMALIGNAFYVAHTDAVMRYAYAPGATTLAGPGTKLTDLPAGPRNHHWTKSLIASRDGTKLYATVGSNSDHGENGMEAEEGRAAIWEIDVATGAKRLFATGLRNPNGLGWEPTTGALWTVVNERDELGNDLVPDYLTSVKDGGFYGWPWVYYGTHRDPRVTSPAPASPVLTPDYALGAHVAPLGLAFVNGGAFVGQHGSWNRRPRSGYNVVFVPFANGKPSGPPVEVLGGFVSADGDALGRPVGVAVDAGNALLVADDVGNTVWRVAAESR